MKIDTDTFNLLCKEVKYNTSNNNHTQAKVIVAKYFNLKHFIKVFEFIEYMHDVDSSLCTDVGSIRTREGKRMMLKVKEILSNNLLDIILFEKLHNSF